MGVIRPIVIKSSPHQVPVTHIRTNLTTAGISRERYFELLVADHEETYFFGLSPVIHV